MKKLITKSYVLQLVINGILTTTAFYMFTNSESESNVVDVVILLLSFAAGAVSILMNGIINGLNFLYLKNDNLKISFYLPQLIWTLLFFSYLLIFLSQGLNGGLDWVFLLLLFQPIIYTTIMIQQIKQKKINKV